jgi:hypothetical protein
LFSGFVKSPDARARVQGVSAILLFLVAVLGWWTIHTDGASPARVIGAVAASVAAVLQLLFPNRRRQRRRREPD